MTSGVTKFHIWHNSELASLRGENSHQKLEFFELKGCESASGGPSVRSPCVENCDLHGNSIVPTSKLSRFHLGVDTIELPCKSQFLTRRKGIEVSLLADS